ncbi:hypothetical protein HPE56_17620 [Maribacter sp. ANRC-HE7]|uniref:Uncharacterized protein n=1 Tax=Maribacter aquimaris TaxID=2737171 RepID=A0ABR7V488_9FLAO|nr:hypothetical protein [Maribacter aquimaris]MBD0779624.1 hypothetical protein [Maribacter aquimaris]
MERTDYEDRTHLGKGLYNEFGIDSALGFEDTKIGEWFHKIGVGLLKKENQEYLFNKAYQTQPALFEVSTTPIDITIRCTSEIGNAQQQVIIGSNEIGFRGTPNDQFFFSNLSGGEDVNATWELYQYEHKIGICERGNFKTNKINLLGRNM